MNATRSARVLSEEDPRFQIARQSEPTNEGSSLVAEDPSAVSLSLGYSIGQDTGDPRFDIGNFAPASDEGSPLSAEDPAGAAFRGYPARRPRTFGLAGLPNLTFGPAGPGGRPVGAASFSSSPPVQGSPVQILWNDFNESDTMAGSYHDEVTVTDSTGAVVFHQLVDVSGIGPRSNTGNYVVWTPSGSGPHTASVRLNVGEYAIPEERIDDNASQVSANVAASYGRPARLGNGISVRQVNGPDTLSPRYMSEQNLGSVPFYGFLRQGLDFNNRFIWLVWPRRRAGDTTPANVDIDLRIELFQEDPQTNPSATPVDVQMPRIQLSENSQYGYEYSRLPPGDFYVRITVTDYSPGGGAGSVLWTQAYG